jgi:LacI family transcriptional regulator
MGTTLKDIAKKAEVSYATVSRALNNHPDVNKNTKEKIIKLANDMNYQPNTIARSLKSKKTNTIGLVIPDITNPFYPQVARGVEEAAAVSNYNVFLCNTNWNPEREKHYVKALIQKQVDGLIMTPSSENINYLKELLDFNIEVVFLSSYIPINNYTSIVTDNTRGMEKAVDYLIKKGHKKIAYAGSHIERYANKERLNGYKKSLMKHNINIDNKYIKSVKNFYDQRGGYKLMYEFLQEFKKTELPSAIVCYNDLLALGIIQALKENNIRIPEDIAIIGFDDISFSSLSEVQLTTVSQSKYEMGKVALKTLLNKLENGSRSTKENKIVLSPKLKIRKTT